jgi:hypothetical protein
LKPEKEVQTDIIKAVRAANGYVIKVLRGNSNGIPDLIICLDGVFIGCEVKAEKHRNNPENQMSAWQHKHKKMIQDANGLFICAASLEQFRDFLEDNLIYL